MPLYTAATFFLIMNTYENVSAVDQTESNIV